MRLIGFDKEKLGGFINHVQDDPAVGDRVGDHNPLAAWLPARGAHPHPQPAVAARPRWALRDGMNRALSCRVRMQQGTIGRIDADPVRRAAVLRSTGPGSAMSARHRAEDVDQVSLTDLLDADEHLPRTVLVELSYATSRGDRQITVRRLSDSEESPRPPPRTAPSTTAPAGCRPAGPTATEGYDAERRTPNLGDWRARSWRPHQAAAGAHPSTIRWVPGRGGPRSRFRPGGQVSPAGRGDRAGRGQASGLGVSAVVGPAVGPDRQADEAPSSGRLSSTRRSPAGCSSAGRP
jgi:hypothetical protein